MIIKNTHGSQDSIMLDGPHYQFVSKLIQYALQLLIDQGEIVRSELHPNSVEVIAAMEVKLDWGDNHPEQEKDITAASMDSEVLDLTADLMGGVPVDPNNIRKPKFKL